MVRHIGRRIARLEEYRRRKADDARRRTCPDCGGYPGLHVTVDPGASEEMCQRYAAYGRTLLEALGGCETCVRLRSQLPKDGRVATIEIHRHDREEYE